MDQSELLRHLVETMDALGIAYMIAGSQAEWAARLGLGTIWESLQKQAPPSELIQ